MLWSLYIKNKMLLHIYGTLTAVIFLLFWGNMLCNNPYTLDERGEGGACAVVNKVISFIPLGLDSRNR